MLSVNQLRSSAVDGRKGNEGIILWLGRREEKTAFITHLALLRGRGITKKPDYLSVSPALVNEVTESARSLEVKIVGQAHSHGRLYSTNLSPIDKTGGFQAPFFLSIVVPEYGLRKSTAIANCGVHVYELPNGYRRLQTDEITSSLKVQLRLSFSTITVGAP